MELRWDEGEEIQFDEVLEHKGILDPSVREATKARYKNDYIFYIILFYIFLLIFIFQQTIEGGV